MNKEQIIQETEYYLEDILSWVKKEDYSSAQRMVSGLRNFMAEIRKEAKQ